MSIDLFLKIEGITGESQDSNHKGWINIDSFTWGASQPGNMSIGGGGGAGKVQYRDLTVSDPYGYSNTRSDEVCFQWKAYH